MGNIKHLHYIYNYTTNIGCIYNLGNAQTMGYKDHIG